jgi:hypothetical protein
VENKQGPAGWELRHGMTPEATIFLRDPKVAWKVPKEAAELALDDQHLSRDAKARRDEWESRNRSSDTWKRIWVLNNGEPWPVYVRVAAENGDRAIEDERYVEVLEWDWGEKLKPALNPNDTGSLPPVITNKPEPTPGLIDRLLKSFKASG